MKLRLGACTIATIDSSCGPVTTAVRALIDSFDAFFECERLEVAIELFRRVALSDELSDEVLVVVADEVFRELDARKAPDPGPEPR